MGAGLPLSESEFDIRWPAIEKELRDWYATETATSFDQAVRHATDKDDEDDDLSIWDEMPELDSKRVVDALVKIEPCLGSKVPVTVIRPGGYASADELVADLHDKIRAMCGPKMAAQQSTGPKLISVPQVQA
ncbi:hypothetical protein [Sorangium sp. So ce1182]|uniref:hypothetical protein n=1 Tax=Sorangium sp. So ce1182 TaxID=3133334 RepID=UPI003F61C884